MTRPMFSGVQVQLPSEPVEALHDSREAVLDAVFATLHDNKQKLVHSSSVESVEAYDVPDYQAEAPASVFAAELPYAEQLQLERLQEITCEELLQAPLVLMQSFVALKSVSGEPERSVPEVATLLQRDLKRARRRWLAAAQNNVSAPIMNRVVLGELLLESLPQLMLQSYNEAQLDQVSTAFLVSVFFSVYMVARLLFHFGYQWRIKQVPFNEINLLA